MKYLIDTDWIIEYLKGNNKIVDFLQRNFEKGLGTSVISIAELYDGVYSSKNPQKHKSALEDFLSGVSVVDITQDACETFGKFRSKLRKKGQLLDNFDLLIASTVKSHELTLLTNNRNHFERLNLEIISESDL